MMCMDVRRSMTKDPRTIDALFDEVRPLAGRDPRFDVMIQHTERLVRAAVGDEFFARPMTEWVARLLQGAELLRYSSEEVVDVFLSTRAPNALGAWGSHFGTVAGSVTQATARKIMQRAMIES
jgi:putative acyl-CoA dehydrogenase